MFVFYAVFLWAWEEIITALNTVTGSNGGMKMQGPLVFFPPAVKGRKEGGKMFFCLDELSLAVYR